jgi:uncharacterized protein (TIRG00374 family)
MKSFVVKAALTVGMLLIIVIQIDVVSVMQRFTALPGLVIALCLCMSFGQIVMLAYRWSLVSILTELRLSFSEFLRCTLAAQFFSQGLPASVGGDALRIWWLTEIDVPVRRAAQNVLIDRLAGFTSLLAVNVPAIPLLAWLAGRPDVATGVGLTLAVCAAIVVFTASRPGRRITIWFWQLAKRSAALGRLKGFLRWVLALQSAAGRLFLLQRGSVVMLWGVCIHLVTIVLCLVLASSAGLNLSFLQLYAIVPGVLLLSYLPFSIGGWGIREGGMAVGLGLLNVPATDAVFIGLALGSFGLVSALAGALVWLVTSMPISLLGRRT